MTAGICFRKIIREESPDFAGLGCRGKAAVGDSREGATENIPLRFI